MFNFKRYEYKNFSYSLLGAVILLCAIGIFAIYKSDASGVGMAKRQLFGVLLGFAVVSVVTFLDYHFVIKLAPLYYVVSIGLLLLVKFSPLGVDHGTHAFRWLNLRVIEIQPSELVKVMMILVMSVIFSKFQRKMDKWFVFIGSAIIMGIPTFLVLIQTDLSSSMVFMFIFVVMIMMAGLSMKIAGMTFVIGMPILLFLFWYVQQPFQVLLTKVQQGRILSFLNPEESVSSGRFQQIKSVQAIASGGVVGKAILKDPTLVKKYEDVYVNESDFIFSVIGEELGLVGTVFIIVLFTFIVFKCIIISKNSVDMSGRLIAIGVSAMLMFQTFVNIGVATEILPNTGLPLPFLSYGLSSLVSNLLAIGFVFNVSLQPSNKRGLSFNNSESEIFF